MHRFFCIFLFIPLFVWAGCDEPVSVDARRACAQRSVDVNDIPFLVYFAQTTDAGELVPFGKYVAFRRSPLPLECGAQTKLSFSAGVVAGIQQSDSNTDTIVFVVLEEEETGELHAQTIPSGSAITIGWQGGFVGTIYAFTIEGIGAPPTEPVPVTLETGSTKVELTVDPEKHIFPRRHVVYVTRSDLHPDPDIGNFSILLTSADKTPSIEPLTAINFGNLWRGRTPGLNVTGPEAINFARPPWEEFELYIFLLPRKMGT